MYVCMYVCMKCILPNPGHKNRLFVAEVLSAALTTLHPLQSNNLKQLIEMDHRRTKTAHPACNPQVTYNKGNRQSIKRNRT